MLGSRKPNSKSPRTPKSPRAPKSPVFIDMGSLNTSPASPARRASPSRSPARWATAVRHASSASPQAARRTSPLLPPPPSYETTVGVNAPLYNVRSPAAMLAAHANAHANAHAATTESAYPSKFITIYYIDMMLAFIDDFAVCCIGMLSGIENSRYIMEQSSLKYDVINKLIIFADNIKSVRYIYKQGDIMTEVIQVEFFLREWAIQDYTNLSYSYSTYCIELRKIWSSLGYTYKGKKNVKEQHAHISAILKKAQYSDEKKLEEIQKYTTAKNKELVKRVNEETRLNKVSLISVNEKLKFITEKIDELGKIINIDFFTPAGKIKYKEYLEIVRRQGTQGGKKRGIAKRGGGLRSSIRAFFKKNKENRVIPVNEDVSQDYMTVLNIYKDTHIDKLRKIYELIASIFNYTEYHRNIAREDALREYNLDRKEYENVLKHFEGDIEGNYPRDYDDAMKQKLENLRKSPSSILKKNRPDLIETSHYVRHILHNFEILKGRKEGLERKIDLYYA
jgi:hypothetical protein